MADPESGNEATRALSQAEYPGAAPGPGSLISGRYRLLDTVGQGGMGVVWRALDETLDRTVAIKQLVLSPALPEEERVVLRERVLREARAAARLHDPAAVTVYDVVTDGDSPWLIMELVDATSLSELIRSDGPRPVREVAQIGLAVLGALSAAHQAGIVHRDVKPGNVMVCANGRILLADFGIAASQGDPSLTQTGLLLGSPAYISPERAKGEPGGPEADLWALGQTLYTAVEGVPAYDSDGALATLTAIVDGRRREPKLAGPLLPVIEALTEPDPRRRATAPEARRMLQDVVDGASPPPRAPDAPTVVLSTKRDVPVEHTQLIDPLDEGEEPPFWIAGSAPAAEDCAAPARPRRTRRGVAAAALALLSVAAITVGILFGTGVFTRHTSGAVGGGTIPAGWIKDDEADFTIYHPSPWTRISVPGGGSAFGQSSTIYERVLVVPTATPLAFVTDLDKAKTAQESSYKRLALQTNGDNQAYLEWTEVEDGTTYHLVDRALFSGNRLYTLTFFAPDSLWGASLKTFNYIAGSFEPGI